MRILAFSDLHCDVVAARGIVAASVGADVVIGAGDFATRRQGAAKTLGILAECAAPVLLVHGNHDDPDEIAALCAAAPQLTYLHGTGITIAGRTFFGLGGEVPARKPHAWNTAHSEAEASALLAPMQTGAILITHTPPFGVVDRQANGAHEGSAAVRAAIKSASARECFCGHIHASWGAHAHLDRTPVTNLGPAPRWFI